MITVTLDTAEWKRLARRASVFSEEVEERVLRRALNRSGDKCFTAVRRFLSDQTGMKNRAVADKMKKWPAAGGDLRYRIRISGAERALTAKSFGAKWNRRWPGVKHKAKMLENPVYGFMIPHDGQSSSRGVAVRRVGIRRKPLEPITVPSLASVFNENGGRDVLNDMFKATFVPEALRLFDYEFSKIGK